MLYKELLNAEQEITIKGLRHQSPDAWLVNETATVRLPAFRFNRLFHCTSMTSLPFFNNIAHI